MTAQTTARMTVVFADLLGSTGLFEANGNVRAARTVTRLTDWMSDIFHSHRGRVVKTLGDGVLAVFPDNRNAVDSVLDIQRRHQRHFDGKNKELAMPIRIGMATGDVEIVAGDCFGDAVNVAARLSDMSGGHQIWAASYVLENVPEMSGSRFRPLGPITIRGRAEPCQVTQIDWKVDENSDFLTMQASIDSGLPVPGADVLGGQITLTWIDQSKTFKSFELPVHIGRSTLVEFVVNDPRVSREHARLEWRNGGLVLVDVSSYGSWVRFAGSSSDLLLRRDECLLHGQGELALGAPLSDLSSPIVLFSAT
jgi:adenylate cyclase